VYFAPAADLLEHRQLQRSRRNHQRTQVSNCTLTSDDIASFSCCVKKLLFDGLRREISNVTRWFRVKMLHRCLLVDRLSQKLIAAPTAVRLEN